MKIMHGEISGIVLQAVQGNPPSIATGRVGAVGHIHLICMKSSMRKQRTNTKPNEIKCSKNMNSYIW